MKNHLSNVIGAGVSLVVGLLCGYVAMFFFQYETEQVSDDLFFNMLGYGFGFSATLLICAFVGFAYRMSERK